MFSSVWKPPINLRYLHEAGEDSLWRGNWRPNRYWIPSTPQVTLNTVGCVSQALGDLIRQNAVFMLLKFDELGLTFTIFHIKALWNALLFEKINLRLTRKKIIDGTEQEFHYDEIFNSVISLFIYMLLVLICCFFFSV